MGNRKIEIKWAIIFTIATLLWMCFEKAMGWHSNKIADHATMTNFFAIIAIGIYVFALLNKRKAYYNGFITWKQGFISGVILSLFVMLLNPLAGLLIHKVISPEYFPNVIAYAIESGQSTKAEAEAYFNLTSYLIQGAVFSLIIGIITGAIVSIFVKKTPKEI